MANFNQVVLMGNLTRDPNLTYTPNQTPIATFGLAVNRKWKMQDGSQGEEVLFIDCTVFGKKAETVNQYFAKGDPIFIRGRLKFEQWEGPDTVRHSRISVVVEDFCFVGSKNNKKQ